MLVILLVLGLSIGACSRAGDPVVPVTPDTAPPKPPVQDATTPSPVMAIVDYSRVDLKEPAVAERFSRADIVVLDMANFWSASVTEDVVKSLKDRNPRVKVIGYVNAHDCWLSWGETSDRYHADWYIATRPYWSYTTTGDTMQAWPGKVLVNVLDPACRSAMIGVLADHLDAYPSRIDGIFWDHFNEQLWVPSDLPGVEGEMDLDGNGLAHVDDPAEQAAYREASTAMITEARARLGADVIQIANGNRAARDSVFAGLLDGMFYENFPEVGFSGSHYIQALDPAVPHNLLAARNWPRTDNGGPWLILSNKFEFSFWDDSGDMLAYREAEFARVMALMAGVAVSYHTEQKTRWGWPEVELALGAATTEPVRDGQRLTRTFEHGTVSLEYKTGKRPVPFSFTIVQNGDTVQAFDLPRHVP